MDRRTVFRSSERAELALRFGSMTVISGFSRSVATSLRLHQMKLFWNFPVSMAERKEGFYHIELRMVSFQWLSGRKCCTKTQQEGGTWTTNAAPH